MSSNSKHLLNESNGFKIRIRSGNIWLRTSRCLIGILTKFLESLKAVDIYEGSQDLKDETSMARPSQESLKHMLEELSLIERQTEQFDAGDMLKLKIFAKGERATRHIYI